MSAARTAFRLPAAVVLADVALLWGMALIIAWLGWSGSYSMFLNPRFLWLTLLTGAALAVLGVTLLLRGVTGAASPTTLGAGAVARPVPLRRALLLGLLLGVSLTATVDWWGADTDMSGRVTTPSGVVTASPGVVTGSIGGAADASAPANPPRPPRPPHPAVPGRSVSPGAAVGPDMHPDARPDARYDDPDAFAGPPDIWEASAKPGSRPGPFDDAPVPDGGEDELGSRATYAGKDYVRINVAELFLLEQRNRPDELAGRYVFRGAVTRHPALDARGAVAVFRVSLYCCLADATAGGFAVRPGVQEDDHPATGQTSGAAQSAPAPVTSPPAPGVAPTLPVPASGGVLAGLRDGQWVEVYGRMTREELPGKLARLAPRDVFAGSLNPGWVFTADAVRLIPPPGDPFIFQWREAEPYLW
uniref:TIGR03943 family protein n=1 Tax=Nitratidesulfovibrio vulgaris (strain DSM 19637 / Miyazaki F) TaxID=883 RepID=B8DQL9_NITV9